MQQLISSAPDQDESKKPPALSEEKKSSPVSGIASDDVLLIRKPLIVESISDPVVALLRTTFYQSLDERDLRPYIKPQARYRDAKLGDTEGDAVAHVRQFLQSEHQSLLILADAGQGKTRLLQQITHQLWQACTQKNTMLPLFIHLPMTPSAERQTHLLPAYLGGIGLEAKVLPELARDYRLILLLDGYDEISHPGNLLLSNHWKRYGGQIKILTTCRPEVLTRQDNYRSLFQPHQGEAGFEEMTLSPFDQKNIERYLQVYLAEQKDDQEHKREAGAEPDPKAWDWQAYLRHIQTVPHLMALLTTPIVLEMVVTVLPDLVKAQKSKKSGDGAEDKPEAKEKTQPTRITQAIIYDYFIQRWIEREKLRLLAREDIRSLSPQIVKRYESYVWTYAENLAHYVLYMSRFTERMDVTFPEGITLNPQLLVNKSSSPDEIESLQITYEDLAAVRSGCLLKATGGVFRFMHKSLIEYFAARSLLDPSAISLYLQTAVGDSKEEKEMADHLLRLNQQSLIQERGVMRFLADRVKGSEEFTQLLFRFIEKSKQSEQYAIAAANAISVLALAGVSLSCRDFRGVRIMGADLTGAVMDDTDFCKADLSSVLFYRAWLKNVKLQEAILTEARFSDDIQSMELPCLITASCFSPNGDWLVLGDENRKIYFYDAKTLEKLAYIDLKIHSIFSDNCINKLVFSHNNQFLYVQYGENQLGIWQVMQNLSKKITLKKIKIIKTQGNGLTVHPNDLLIAYALSPSSNIIIQRIPDLTIIVKIDVKKIHKEAIRYLCFNSNGEKIAAATNYFNSKKNSRGSYNGHSISIWDLKSPSSDYAYSVKPEDLNVKSPEGGEIFHMVFSQNNNALIWLSKSDQPNLIIWKFTQNQYINIPVWTQDGGCHYRDYAQSSLVLQTNGRLAALMINNHLSIIDLSYQQLLHLKNQDKYSELKSLSNGYEVCLMSDDEKLEKGKFYLKKEGDLLRYTVINPAGKKVEDKIFTDKFEKIIPEPLSIGKLKQFLSEIFEITSKRGHTYSKDQYESWGREFYWWNQVKFDPFSKKILTIYNKDISKNYKSFISMQNTENLLASQGEGHQCPIFVTTEDNEQETLLTASREGTICSWQISTGNLLRTFKLPKSYNKLYGLGLFSEKNTSFLVIIGENYGIRILETNSGQLIFEKTINYIQESLETGISFVIDKLDQYISKKTLNMIQQIFANQFMACQLAVFGESPPSSAILDLGKINFTSAFGGKEISTKLKFSKKGIEFEIKPHGAIYFYKDKYLYKRTHDIEFNCEDMVIDKAVGLTMPVRKFLIEQGCVGEPMVAAPIKSMLIEDQKKVPLFIRSSSVHHIAQLEEDFNQLRLFLDQDNAARRERQFIQKNPALNAYCTMLRVELNRFMLALEVLSTDLIQLSDDVSAHAIKAVAAAAKQIPGTGLLFEFIKTAVIFSHDSARLKKMNTLLLAFRDAEDIAKILGQFSRQLTMIKSQQLITEPVQSAEEKGIKQKLSGLYQIAKEYAQDKYKEIRVGIQLNRHEKEAICDAALLLDVLMNGVKLDSADYPGSLLKIILNDPGFRYDAARYLPKLEEQKLLPRRSVSPGVPHSQAVGRLGLIPAPKPSDPLSLLPQFIDKNLLKSQ